MLINLEKDEYPILLEGIHCSYPLFTGRFKNRKIFLRLHNVEHKYYSNLAVNETNIFKKISVDPHKYDFVKQNGYDLIRNYYSKEAVIEKLLDFYKTL